MVNFALCFNHFCCVIKWRQKMPSLDMKSVKQPQLQYEGSRGVSWLMWRSPTSTNKLDKHTHNYRSPLPATPSPKTYRCVTRVGFSRNSSPSAWRQHGSSQGAALTSKSYSSPDSQTLHNKFVNEHYLSSSEVMWWIYVIIGRSGCITVWQKRWQYEIFLVNQSDWCS